jgi:hypothetical protein
MNLRSAFCDLPWSSGNSPAPQHWYDGCSEKPTIERLSRLCAREKLADAQMYAASREAEGVGVGCCVVGWFSWLRSSNAPVPAVI